MTSNEATVAPALQTPRLLLRRHTIADFAASAAMWADESVTRYIGGRPSTPQQTWSRMLGYAGLWAMLGYGYWAIEERASGAFVGEVGFADFKRAVDERMRAVPEAGWALAPSAHGKGYATEAVLAAMSWGDRHLASARTVCLINPDNAASIRIAEKCGFVQFERTRFNDEPILFFERRRDGPPALQTPC